MNDEELLEGLARSLASVNDPSEPPRDTALAAFAMRDLDGALAALVHDSLIDPDGHVVRSGSADARHLSFEAEGLVLEVGIEAGRLVGQILPAQDATVDLHRDDRFVEQMSTDALGLFEATGALSGGRFILIARTSDGRTIRTPLFRV